MKTAHYFTKPTLLFFEGICLLILALVLINQYFPILGFYGYDNKRIFQVLLIVVTHSLLLKKSILSIYLSFLFTCALSLKWLVGIIFFAGFVVVFRSEFSFYAGGDWLHYLLLCNAILIVCAFCIALPIARYVLLVSVFCGFILALSSFLFMCVFSVALSGHIVNPWDTYPNIANIRFFNQIHIQLVFLLAAISLLVPSRYFMLTMIVGGLSHYMLLVAYGRGAIISIFAVYMMGLLLSIYVANVTLKKLLANFFKMFLLGVFFFFLMESLYFFIAIDTVNSTSLFRSNYGRLGMWVEVVNGIWDSPLGIGAYHYSSFNAASPSSYEFSHPHNFLLQLTQEWGLFAGVGLIVLALWLFVVSIKKMVLIEHPVILGLFLSVWAAWCYSFFSGVFVMPASQVVFVVLLGVLLSYPDVGSKVSVNAVVTYKYYLSTIIVVVSLLGLYLFYVTESYHRYRNGVATEFNYVQSTNSDNQAAYEFMTKGPRMWSMGGIVVPIYP